MLERTFATLVPSHDVFFQLFAKPVALIEKHYLDLVAAIQSGLVADSECNATLMNIMTHSCVSCSC